MPIVVRQNKLRVAELKLRELMISQHLIKHQGNRKMAAADLGVTSASLNQNIARLKIDVPLLLEKAWEAQRKKIAASAHSAARIPVKGMAAGA